MSRDTSDEEAALVDDISKRAASLWQKSRTQVGRSDDPKMFSVMLFKRLQSHHRGYVVLWNHRLLTEADIILRAGIEAAICLTANYVLREKFVELMRGDAMATLKGQIKLHRDLGDSDLVRESEAGLRLLQDRFPAEAKLGRLNWAELALHGGVPQLYDWHRQLSGVSSHVTGLSVLTAVGPAGEPSRVPELNQLNRKMHLMMMAGATLQGSLAHAGMLDDEPEAEAVRQLVERMNEVSLKWSDD